MRTFTDDDADKGTEAEGGTGGDAGDADGNTTETETQSGTQADGNSGESGAGPEDFDDQVQAEVQRIARGIRQEERQKTESASSAKLEELQTKATQWDEHELSQKSLSEQMQATIDASEERIRQLTEQSEKTQSDADQALLHAAVISQASKRFANPEAVVRLVDLSSVERDAESGKYTGIDTALAALAESDPWTLTPKVGSPGPTNPEGDHTQVRTDDDRRREYFQGQTSNFFEGGGVQVRDKTQDA